MKRKHVILIASGIVILIAILGFTIGCHNAKQEPEPEIAPLAQGIDTVPMLITQVQKCSKLYTAEYRVHKIITHDDALRLKGQLMSKAFDLKVPLADRKIAIPMDAKIKAYIDFSEFSEKNIERSGDKITIILPDPQVVMTSSKIDQKNVKQYVGLTRANFSDEELASYQQQGRDAIIKSIPDMGIVETAQANSAKVLVPMLKQFGFEEQNITIAFRNTNRDWKSLIRFEE